MPYNQLDRHQIVFKSLKDRKDRTFIEKDHVSITDSPRPFPDKSRNLIDETIDKIIQARHQGTSRMLVFGAHTIKNGLSPVLVDLIEKGWITHLATNGAGIIHDWEFAFQGSSSEHVAENVRQGQFGVWQETGFYLNLALVVGAYRGFGYGESVGSFVEDEGLDIPSEAQLIEEIRKSIDGMAAQAAAAADLLETVRVFNLKPGWMSVPHPYKKYGLQAAAYRLKIPFTGHPMIGHDIIYIHPMNHCAAIGRAAERDFLTFAQGVSNLDGGVYISIGSAVMSPMIFEKSLSMSQNLAIQMGSRIENHHMIIVDLAESHWDWQKGEPPEDNPDYYLRYNKSFSRMGGTMRYLSADNCDFLLALSQGLRGKD